MKDTSFDMVMGLNNCISAPNLIFPLDNFDNGGTNRSAVAWLVMRASVVPGYHGQALYTNDSNRYVEMSLNQTNQCLQNPDQCGSGVTFSFWVMNLPGNTAHLFYHILVSNGCRQGNLGFCFGLGLKGFWVVIRCRYHEYRNRIPPLEVNKWQHVTVTFIAHDMAKLYVNGCDSAPYRRRDGYQLVAAISGSATARSTYLQFGSKVYGTHMKLDHVLIWYDVLSADEIWKLYLQGGTV